ncbi:ABC transporter ATP-binding protein [Paenibacillus caui]|uniref:ABC transporter ATP-binding protein n=1 Tax=Paenibacillus caui TaxID=2873927 RepID=UPI001CA8A751|nr:ABC transporter ATP-binding protein [Paenibacillus caui]
MRRPVIEFRDFSFRYKAQSEPTLHHITFSVYEGEKVLIVGPSGSGKSTLAHCINGLIPFFHEGEMTGSVMVGGRELLDLSMAELSDLVGTVLQDPDGQFVGLTVGEDIAFKLENDMVPRAEMVSRVEIAAAATGISELLEASPHELSGGQKQKTTLAGVLVGDAGILLFDEPLANLDPESGRTTVELIDRIHRETAKTVIIIEHRLEEMLHRDVDRILVVRDGRIAADLPAPELLCSGLLAETGLREPLYLTALKYAGCEIAPDMNPQQIGQLRLDACAEKLAAWYRANPAPSESGLAPPLLELRDVSFSYVTDRPALSGISLIIGQGEMVCIAGRNGAGKSTVSKLICGFYRPSAGTLLMNGRDIRADTIKERAQRIGYVMQNPNHMISKALLYDEVALGLRARGLPEAEIRERVHEALKVCGLYSFRSWPISALSYGQKKRVTIASILVLRPELMILDEPTAGQDFRHYNEMMEFLNELNRQGMTIVIITHDMYLMMEYAQRTIVFADGLKISDDTPSRVLSNLDLLKAANLKKTSLHELADKAGFQEPDEFISRFIAYDRRVRNR